MSIVPGTRLGPYEVVSLLGAGGMGEVYAARAAGMDERDGRFLINPLAEEATVYPIALILNWKSKP